MWDKNKKDRDVGCILRETLSNLIFQTDEFFFIIYIT